MPELPEVEANRRNLERWIRGRTIVSVAPPPGTRETKGLPPRDFVRRLRGKRVESVARRGKWILLRLSGGAGLGLHLGMTGKLAQTGPGAPAPRFARATFALDDKNRVHFVDSRRFGRLLAEPVFETLVQMREVATIGPDALADLDVGGLRTLLARSRRTIKETLLDQTLIAGLGNIYATEALWHARISPREPARDVGARLRATNALLAGIQRALKHGIETYGAPAVPTYIEEGGDNPFFVYGRGGAPCPRCKTTLRTETIGGRTTVYCPKCQKR